MSNLVKQYYVTNDNTPIRVINSSRKFDEKLKKIEDFNQEQFIKNARRRGLGEPIEPETEAEMSDAEMETSDNVVYDEGAEFQEDGSFVEGIDALRVETDESLAQAQLNNTSEEIERLLAEAKAEAEQILAEARQQAEAELADAKAQAELLYEDSKANGYEEGIQSGTAEVEALKLQLQDEIATKQNELQVELDKRSNELERDIVEAMIQVFNKVFHIQFDDKKELLLHLIKNTLMNVEVGREFRIHVSQNNYKFINMHLDDVRERVGNDVEIEVVNDAALDSSDCQIETSFGVFDCGIDMELTNLVKDIRSLCS